MLTTTIAICLIMCGCSTGATTKTIVGNSTIACGKSHTAAVKNDGTVIATGSDEYNQCDVKEWTDIIAVDVGISNTIALKKDGTVVAAGRNDYGQCDVEDWSDIVDIEAGMAHHVVGLKDDGTVVSRGYDLMGDCDTWD